MTSWQGQSSSATSRFWAARWAQAVLLFLLRSYKYCLSPLLPPACRFTPTCSEYAIEAVQKYGPFRGTCMAVGRLLRCHPFCRGGYDPVK